MGKIICTILFISLVQLMNDANCQTKAAHVNSQILMDTLPSRKKALLEIKEISNRGNAELNEMDEQLQKAYSEYLKNKEMQSSQLNQYDESRLQKMQQNLQKREQELNILIQDMTSKMNESTYKLIQTATKNIATKKGFQYVLEEASILFAGGTDITSEVIVELLKLDLN